MHTGWHLALVLFLGYPHYSASLASASPDADINNPSLSTNLRLDSQKNNAEKLKALRKHIHTLQKDLERTRGKRDTEKDRLRDLERRIGELIVNIKKLDREQKKQSKKLNSLSKKKNALGTARNRQLKALERQVHTAYIIGKQEYLKLLFNQEDPSAVSRVLVYHRYLNESRLERIQAFESTLVQLHETEKQIAQQVQELELLRLDQNEKKQKLEQTRSQRTQILARLNQRVRSQSEEIRLLRTDEQQLERLLNGIQDLLTDDYEIPAMHGRFRKYKGKLPLPARGKIVARYGAPKNIGDLRWRGLFLAGREGQDVRSIFRGRVAFADWLRGFGLLLILDHGDGYMTLYGHNQSLYKEVGDWVEAGQVIAGMGNTGDITQPGLYFEVRHNGKPRDPLLWCRAR